MVSKIDDFRQLLFLGGAVAQQVVVILEIREGVMLQPLAQAVFEQVLDILGEVQATMLVDEILEEDGTPQEFIWYVGTEEQHAEDQWAGRSLQDGCETAGG